MIDHLNAFALAVRDVKKCAEFYRDKLGFKLKVLENDFAYLTISEKPGPGLALVSFDGFAEEIVERRVGPRTESVNTSYFAVFVDDTDREYEELSRKGVRFVTPPSTRPSGQRWAYFEDPECNLWEISHFPRKQEAVATATG
jgi:catechol 2,3-dioxygenase-like lactoylglutathione lyase family enzyme